MDAHNETPSKSRAGNDNMPTRSRQQNIVLNEKPQ